MEKFIESLSEEQLKLLSSAVYRRLLGIYSQKLKAGNFKVDIPTNIDPRWWLRNSIFARFGECERGCGDRSAHLQAVDLFAAHYESKLIKLLELSKEFTEDALDVQRILDEGQLERARILAAAGTVLWGRMKSLTLSTDQGKG